MPPSLLVDLYELTMAAGYLREGVAGLPAAFDLYFRRNPFDGGYAVFAGLETALEHLESLRFTSEDLAYVEGLRQFDRAFLDWLGAFRFRGRVTAVPEGEVVFALAPLVTVEGGLAEAQIVETALLNLVNYATLVATKAARVAGEAGAAGVIEFGARRAPGPDGALTASRAAFIGGATGTSHLEAGRRFGIPVAGTQAHSWVMAFPSELQAFRAYAAAFPGRTVLLVDTIDTLRSGVPNAITVAREMRERGESLAGIRLDSGDLARLSGEARRMLDEAGFPEVRIVASNDLDEEAIASIRGGGGRVDDYGVGTRLTTAAGERGGGPGGIYKLVECAGRPRVKVSSDPAKATIPGIKRLWRITDSRGAFVMDVLSRHDETPRPGETVVDPDSPAHCPSIPEGARITDLRQVVMEGGQRTGSAPPVAEAAARAKESLGRLPDGCRRLLNPRRYCVGLTRGLHDQRQSLIESVRP